MSGMDSSRMPFMCGLKLVSGLNVTLFSDLNESWMEFISELRFKVGYDFRLYYVDYFDVTNSPADFSPSEGELSAVSDIRVSFLKQLL